MHREWLYIMVHIPFLLIIKIGISKNTKKRRKQISDSVPGFVVPIFCLPLLYAQEIEQWLHKSLAWMNVPFVGSGKTEYFFILAIIPALITMILVFALERLVYVTIAIIVLKILNVF
jgi:hypothetical protein